MVTLLIFLIILSVLIVVHEFGHFFMARRNRVRVEEFSLGFGPNLLTRKKDDTEYKLNAIPFGGYVKLAGDNLGEYQGQPDEYLSKSLRQRGWIVFFGPLLNYLLGIVCFWIIFFVGYPTLTTSVGGLLEGFGAQEAGIQVGDRIINIDGKAVKYWEDIQRIVYTKKVGSLVRILVMRDNKEYVFDVKIKDKKLEDALGQKRTIGVLGITPKYDELIKVRRGFLQSFILSLERTLNFTVMTYKALWFMLTGKLSIRESVTGPLGIFYITSEATKLGISAVLNLVGILSTSLAIFNLLPLPVLDGGHILLLAIEKIRGRRLSLKTERLINQIGFTFVVSLAILVTYNDIVRFFGNKLIDFLKR